MNKKLETAMEECAEAFADQEGELISKDGPTGVQDNRKFPDGFLDQWMMRHGYKAGFQKCYELMAEREAPSVDDWRGMAEALYQRLQELQSEGMDNHGDKMAVRKYEQFKKERGE